MSSTNHSTEHKISAIIPCFNYGLYIDDSIHSLINQTIPPKEIIIIDDGSTDDLTKEKLKDCPWPLTKVVTCEQNCGPGAARNKGFACATGDYLVLLDADDLFQRTFIEKSLQILSRYPRVGAVSSWTLCFGDEDYIWFPLGGGLENFLQSTSSPACSLIRREAWLVAGGFDETYNIGYEDWDFWIRLTKKNWFVHIIPELLFYYRQKKASRVKDTFQNHGKIYDNIKRNHSDIFN